MTADRWTDQELKKLEARISKEYGQAEKDLKHKADEYFKQYTERWEKEYKAYEAGKYTDEQFKAWELSQLGRGAHWEDLKDQMSERLAQASLIAQDYINGKLPAIYTKNSNEVAKIAQDSAIAQGVTGIRFDLVDEHTVKRLMMGSREVRPFKPVAIDLPKTNRFNYTKLQNCLLQGILQGDSINKIAERFQTVSNMNKASAIRNARTAVTGAQNAGKQDRYSDLASKGCEVYKMWIATADERTREEHMQAWNDYGSKETAIPYDEPFDVGEEELMYPADPNGSGWNIYNCRCTMKSFTKFKSILSDEMREKANIRLVEDKPQNEPNAEPQTQASRWENNLTPRGQAERIELISDTGDEFFDYVKNELNVSQEEAEDYVISIMSFTMSDYKDIRAFQAGKIEDSERLLEFTEEKTRNYMLSEIDKKIETYIEEAPRWNGGTTYRGISLTDDELNQYLEGKVIDMGGTSSWSATESISRDFAENNAKKSNSNAVLFECETQSKGTGISHFSVFKDEDEVICSKDSKYVIKEIKNINGTYHIKLEEE